MESNDKKTMGLKARILSEENIYNAIYSLESYVSERGLLSDEDIELYYKLQDKFNYQQIGKTIGDCREIIKKLLNDSGGEELFEVKIYFKIKKLNEDGSIKYRPLHTASLKELICMVSMLNPLMFDDTSRKRRKSQLSLLIPHNFYGNIPGDRMEHLFKPWMAQYKQYSEKVIERCKEYQGNHEYKTEVTLDIKEFFPSVSPEFMFEYIVEKLRYQYVGEDMETLKRVLTKLLIQKVDVKLIQGWESEYYGDFSPKKTDTYLTRGIAQGLPQSYFLGNLCMVEIMERIGKCKLFYGWDPYFYVDDSVIYIDPVIDKEVFDNAITSINKSIEDIGNYKDKNQRFEKIGKYLSENHRRFQSSIDYKIEFHTSGKSEFCPIEDANLSIAGLNNLMKSVSGASWIFGNIDETEDRYTYDKLNRICELIDDEICRVETIVKDGDEKDSKEPEGKNHIAARLKLLKRYKRFFLFRKKFLDYRLKEDIDDIEIKAFYNRFNIERYIDNNESEESLKEMRRQFFDNFDEEIFQTEAKLLISLLPEEMGAKLSEALSKFERRLTGVTHDKGKALFFSRDFAVAIGFKKYISNPYSSISLIIHRHFSPHKTLSQPLEKRQFEEFIKELQHIRDERKLQEDIQRWNELIPFYARFVFWNSDEFCRVILNTYYSIQTEVYPSESQSFTKLSKRGVHYIELRILSRLRNREFKLGHFIRVVEDLDANDLENRMSIDLGILEAIGTFISKVKNPDWVDDIIVTHRIVKSLWHNGSKFMNSYTLHNEEHAVTLINAVMRLTKAIDNLTLKTQDYYILFLACYLHDISMVIHPKLTSFCNTDVNSQKIITDFISEIVRYTPSANNTTILNPAMDKRLKQTGHFILKQFYRVFDYFESKVRDGHTKDSGEMIRKWQGTMLKHLSPFAIDHVAKVSESHGYDSAEVYGLKSEARCSLVSMKYMMILIRLADLMDVTNDRINYNLLRQNVEHMSLTSQFHWISHLVTDEIQLAPKYQQIKINNGTNESIQNRKLIECLNFNLYINGKFISVGKPDCREGECRLSPLDCEKVLIPDDYSKTEGFMLETESRKSNKKALGCPIICKWMMKKHKWFINEIDALEKYLNSINNKWFQTEIRLNIIYRDDYKLEADLFDKIQEYLK